MIGGGEEQNSVKARDVVAFWAVRYLGLTATEVGREFGLSKSAVSRAGEKAVL